MFNRRTLFKGLAAVLSSQILPNASPAVTSAAEIGSVSVTLSSSTMGLTTSWMDALDPRETPILSAIKYGRAIEDTVIEWGPFDTYMKELVIVTGPPVGDTINVIRGG